MKKLKYANFGQRLIGHVVDNIITIASFIALVLVFNIFGILLYFGFLYYNYIHLVSKKGASLGKKVAGIRIVDNNKKNLTKKSAFVRFIVKDLCFLFTIFGAIAYIYPMSKSKSSQSLGDKAVNSYVIEGRCK